jgi:hypothetical protein
LSYVYIVMSQQGGAAVVTQDVAFELPVSASLLPTDFNKIAVSITAPSLKPPKITAKIVSITSDSIKVSICLLLEMLSTPIFFFSVLSLLSGASHPVFVAKF